MLKNDAWIRRMAKEHGMIVPFEPGQVREITLARDASSYNSGNAVTQTRPEKVISYGVSSYGYDLRVADEFKVFSPVRGGIIDPKKLDERVLVDVSDQVKEDGFCLIPPNSFALARSVERFKIPRDVLALCLGKSSYARCGIIVNVTPFEPCLSADSEILTSDGWRSMVDVKVGDLVLTRREDGVAEYQPVERKQAHEFQGSMLHFAGRSVDQLTTPDHKLFVWRRNSRQNTYEGMTIEAREVFGKHNYSFDRQVEWSAPEKHAAAIEINGATFPFDAFLRFLGCYLGDGSAYLDKTGGYMVKLAAVTKERKFAYFGQVLEEMGIKNARRHERGWRFYNKALATYLMQFGHAREKFIDRRWMGLDPEKLGLLIDGMIESDGNRETMTFTTTSRRLADDFQEIVFKSGSAAIVREVECEIHGNTFNAFKVRVCDTHMAPKMSPRNHKKVTYDGMVYDVTVPNHIFFMRRDGKASWTGNCWEGWPTLEISNTTGAFAKIYANEGLAQVIFLGADEVCERSYADRKGKYQNQGQEIVSPRM